MRFCVLSPFYQKIMFTFYFLKSCLFQVCVELPAVVRFAAYPWLHFFFTVEDDTEYTIIGVKSVFQPFMQIWWAGGPRHRCYLCSSKFFSILKYVIPVFCMLLASCPEAHSIYCIHSLRLRCLEAVIGHFLIVNFKVGALKCVLRAWGINNSAATCLPWSQTARVALPSNGSVILVLLRLSVCVCVYLSLWEEK